MGKDLEKKPHHEGVSEELVGKSNELITLLTNEGEEREWALSAVANEGPLHKQVYSALLLERMNALVKEVEAQTGSAFAPQKGVKINSEKDGWEISIPFVANGFSKKDAKAIVEAVSHSPAHEIVAFNTLLQGIEWCLAALHLNAVEQ